MKTRFLLLTLALATSLFAIAEKSEQNDKQAEKQKMREKKIAFINEYVGFTPNEAALFWTANNEFEKEISELFGALRAVKRKINEQSSDSDYENALQTMMETETKVHELRQKYFQEYQKILSPAKLFRYYNSEKEYRRFLLKEISQKKAGEKGQQPQK